MQEVRSLLFQRRRYLIPPFFVQLKYAHQLEKKHQLKVKLFHLQNSHFFVVAMLRSMAGAMLSLHALSPDDICDT
jgi:hypothetical protein